MGNSRSKTEGAAAIRPRAGVGILRCDREGFAVGPRGSAGNQAQVHAAGGLVREVDDAQPRDALDEESGILLRREDCRIAEKELRPGGVDIDPAKTLDVEQATHIQHVQFIVESERDGARRLALPHAVVEKLEVHALARAVPPT